ncbi:probable ATP-dependent RNA helicase DHX37 [Branchiostoma floridae]|uniref:RNA helicase n=1 Tax=Branchiostoma floridae TaxID=7739 RepID=A0A9J7MIR5_BRAFL|nr:probable ATP-dependent RNA helicase DHX37 [Branchiostoma floridae]XP_035668852.1 probable ATP-dependent RNA helicase DHX37 [Branchiostoma floridae]XP_035668853.1 probable ATP-dependent RNA helicase DHX37 [Branchiostoma floridae]
MGRLKRRHNWKARQGVGITIDNAGTEDIKLELQDKEEVSGIDACNALVLPSQKRKVKKVEKSNKPQQKPLSKKQKKLLQRKIEQKEKKAKRADLLESLSQVQVHSEELKLLQSTQTIHGKLTKRPHPYPATSATGSCKVNSISGSKKRKMTEEVETESESESSDSDLDDNNETEICNKNREEITSIEREQVEKEDSDIVKYDEKTAEECYTGKKGSDDVANTQRKKDEKAQSTGKRERRDSTPAVYVPVERRPDIQESRLQLPILAEEQVLMEAIKDNPVVVVCGETGSGKTTQIPQFLYEAGYGRDAMIGITEPRRVAAVSMSQRVAEEMNLSQRTVSYQIRYEGNVTPETKVKFMTDGVLLKEMQKDLLLSKYSVLVIDEAHERSVYTDILIGLLSRVVPLRTKKGNPLKLVIMSATLRIEDFTHNQRLFKISPPVIKVNARQFPVTVHFNKQTPGEYLQEAYKKVCKIHRMLPAGGILVFLTGQAEVHALCRKLQRSFPSVGDAKVKKTAESKETKKSKKEQKLLKIDLDNYTIEGDEDQADDGILEDDIDLEAHIVGVDDEDDMDDNGDMPTSDADLPIHVLPLYSLLPPDRQQRVFLPPPAGSRLVVVATNVAETSLTIPHIKYVVDTGKVKKRFYDKVTGASAFQVTWVSKASADQRAGRAGRTEPGHCYRLYSSAVFSDFQTFSPPEIARRPVEDLVLQMKDMSIDKVVNFPFPTPPDVEAVHAAEQLLVQLGALQHTAKPKDPKAAPSPVITPLGRAMARFPVSPRFSKMLALGEQHGLLPYVISIVAALTVQEIFLSGGGPAGRAEEQQEQQEQHAHSSIAQLKNTWAGQGQSLLLGDIMVLLRAVGACEFAGCTNKFCEDNGLRYKAMTEIRSLRTLLTNAINTVCPGAKVHIDPNMRPPTELQAKLLRQIMLSGLGDRIARRVPTDQISDKSHKFAYQSTSMEEYVFIHPSSVLTKTRPEYVIFHEIIEARKPYMHCVAAVEPEWIPLLVPNLCTFSEPVQDVPPTYDSDTGRVRCHRTSTFSRLGWQMPSVEGDYPEGLDRYKWFAKFLLEGAVFPELKRMTPLLLSPPAIMVKPWANLQPRTQTLLKALVSSEADNRDSLQKAWEKNNKFLLSAFAEWVPQSILPNLTEMWPPV